MSTTRVQIDTGECIIEGNLYLPVGAKALVIFSHGSGSSRFSPRNNYVAGILNKEGIGTLLIDLLSPEEDAIYANRFNIERLTNRLIKVTDYVTNDARLKHLNLGFFGASTGAASALKAAASLGSVIKAVVSRGGRPDLAAEALPQVEAPTLLIVGSLDDTVIGLNRRAFALLRGTKDLKIINGATHLFEEPGKLTEVAQDALLWFTRYLK